MKESTENNRFSSVTETGHRLCRNARKIQSNNMDVLMVILPNQKTRSRTNLVAVASAGRYKQPTKSLLFNQ